MLVSCSVLPAPAPTPSPLPPTQAGDLRTQLDLLLTEHVMIVAKESAAAVNGSAEYPAYAALLATNEDALTRVVRGTAGSTTASHFTQAWRALNSDLVEYSIRIATHDGEKADAATSRLTATTMPQLAEQLAELTLGQSQPLLVLVTSEVTALRDTIDAAADHHYAAMYVSLASAVSTAASLGDMLASKIVLRFPDKFPGDQTASAVVRRVHLNVLTQQRAYLLTMATDAQVNGRSDEKAQAVGSLSANLNLIVREMNSSRSKQAWSDELSTIQRYASTGDDVSRNTLTETFVTQFASITNVSPGIVSNQVNATIKVIDDQRAKKVDDVASDDRAAATAMAPLADSL